MTENAGEKALARIDTHEAVCAERYAGIRSRLGRIEWVLLAVFGAVAFSLFKSKLGLP